MPFRDSDKDSEQQLAQRLRLRDHKAMRMVYDAYARYLTGVCARYIVDDNNLKDVLQEAFVRIYDAAPGFEYRGPGSLKGWMARIVVNQALKHLRDNKALFVPITEQQEDIPEDDPDTEDVPASEIYRMIRELPEGYRTVFNLYVVEGRSHKEISTLLDIGESTSASQLHRAKVLLASKIREYQRNK